MCGRQVCVWAFPSVLMTASSAITLSTPAAKSLTSLDYSSVELPIKASVKGVRTGVSTFRFTCIAACRGPKVALGTQHGHTIVVSHELGAQRVRTIRPPAEDAGPARSVDWSVDGSGLVVGYASGAVALFDANTYALQKLVRDMQNSPITAVAFWGPTGRQNLLTTDELGRCYMLTFNTFLVTMTCEKKLLLKKEKPVKAMAALRGSKMVDAGLVAMVSEEALTVVGMVPTPRLVFEMPLSEADSLSLCWCTEPVMLCVGVGKTLHMLRPREDLTTFDVIGQVLLPSKDFSTGFRGIRCVGGGLVAAVVAPAQEPSAREVILVQTNRPRGTMLRGTGQVVYRHRLLGTYCPDLITVIGSTVVLPGYQAGADSHHFTEVTVGYWQDEIKKLMDQQEMSAAITLVSGIGSGSLPQLADVYRPNSVEMEALLRVFLLDMPKDDLERVQECVTLAVDACASMALWDFLYSVVFARCEACGEAVRDVYLKVVETRLRSGVLPAGTVDSEIVAFVLARFQDELAKDPTVEVRRAAEDFCLSVNPESLDLNFTTRMATEFGLWSVVVYIYNVAFGDYTTPLQLFVDASVRAMERLQAKGQRQRLASMPLVEYLYSYLASTLAGKPYPLETPTPVPKPPATAVNDLVKAVFSDTSGCFDQLLEISASEFFKALPLTEECIQQCSIRMTKRPDRDVDAEAWRSYYVFVAKACQVLGIAIEPREVRQQVLKVMLEAFPEKRIQVAFERIYEDDKCASIDVAEFVKEAAAKGMRSVQAWALGHCLGDYQEMLACYLDAPQLSEDIFDDIIRSDDPQISRGIRTAALALVRRLIELNPAETGRLFMDGTLELEESTGPVVKLGDISDDLYCAFLLPLLNPDSSWRNAEGRRKFYRAHAMTGLELLLRTDRQSGVSKFLLRADKDAIPLDQARELCQRYSSVQGMLCLCEKAEDDDGAVTTVLDALAKAQEESHKLELVSLAADFTLRRAEKLQPEQISKLWMPCLAMACDDLQISEMLLRKGGVLDLVPVGQSIETLLRKRPGRRVDDDALRKPLVSLLGGIGFSYSLAEATEDICRQDASKLFSDLVSRQSRALSVGSVLCQGCQRPLVGEGNISGKVTIFDCGHTYHDKCCQPEPDEMNPSPTLRECKLCRWG